MFVFLFYYWLPVGELLSGLKSFLHLLALCPPHKQIPIWLFASFQPNQVVTADSCYFLLKVIHQGRLPFFINSVNHYGLNYVCKIPFTIKCLILPSHLQALLIFKRKRLYRAHVPSNRDLIAI